MEKENINLIKKLKNKFNTPLSELQMLAIYFFIYAFIGWILETIYCYHLLGHFEKRGFLYGPICPMYGYGSLILFAILKPFKKNKLLLFVYSTIVFSIFEYLVSYGLDALFSMKFWDYTNNPLNLNGRITFYFSLLWGFFGIIFMYYIHPIIEMISKKTFNKSTPIFQHIIFYIIILIYTIDTIFSIVKYILPQ